MKRTASIILAILTLLPCLVFPAAITASGKPAAGTMVYYEGFDYSDTTGNATVLSKLGWTLSEELNKNTAKYSIEGGKLLCDNLSATVGKPKDSYVTVLDDAAMSEVAEGDYTISYDLTYVSAENPERYVAMIYNYNGYKTYNTTHIRIGGTGNNQARIYGSTYKTYDNPGVSDAEGFLGSSGKNSVSKRVFGISPSTSAPYPLEGRTMTVTLKVDKDRGTSVYINGILLSSPNSTYSEFFEASQEYSSAIALKTSLKVKAYVDNIAVYTGLGNMPSNKKVTYKHPATPNNGNEISVMTFNILFDATDAVSFGNGIKRAEHATSLICGMYPDIVGIQERQTIIKTEITDVLKKSGYSVVDEYRTDTTSSGILSCTPIFYNPQKFELVENSSSNGNLAHGTFVFANSYQTTNQTISKTKIYTKSLSWAVLKNKASGQLVLAMNTHFAVHTDSYTNYTSKDAVRDRAKNAEQTLAKMSQVFAKFGNLPTVFTGDFNMRQDEQGYRILSEQFSDSIHLAPDSILYEYSMTNKSDTITNTNFLRSANAPIDHIFVNNGAFTVNSYNVLNDCKLQMIASDHCAIISKMTLEPVSAPVCSHKTGIYSGTQNVTLKGTGTIYYTTDNSDPTTSKTRKTYSSAIKITGDTVLRYTSYSGGKYSRSERRTLYFGTPFYITEAIKNPHGDDFFEGVEIINVSSVPLDMSDFRFWEANNTNESAAKNVAASSVTTNMRISHKEGEYVIAPGEVVYIALIFSDHYFVRNTIASGKSVYYCEMDPVTAIAKHRLDYLAQGMAYHKIGNITADRIIPLDRTARSIGYSANGTLVKRHDYPSTETSVKIHNLSNSFNIGNSMFNRLFMTFANDQDVSGAFCICDMDSTDNGTYMSGLATKSNEGAYHYIPNGSSALMTTASFTIKSYSIGSINEAQKSAFASVNRSGNSNYLTPNPTPETTVTQTPVTTAPIPDITPENTTSANTPPTDPSESTTVGSGEIGETTGDVPPVTNDGTENSTSGDESFTSHPSSSSALIPDTSVPASENSGSSPNVTGDMSDPSNSNTPDDASDSTVHINPSDTGDAPDTAADNGCGSAYSIRYSFIVAFAVAAAAITAVYGHSRKRGSDH